jgi:hypothetical protein
VDGVTWKEYETGLEARIVDLLTTESIVERIRHNHHGESIFRRPTGGNVRWVSQLWRTKLFNRLW